MAGEHQGHRVRMRERFRKQGLDGFADHEALELMLFYAIPQRNVNPLAHALLERFGSLHGVLEAHGEDLQKVEGVGEYAATLLNLFAAVAVRLPASRAGEREYLRNRGEAEAHCLRLLNGLRREHMYAICLNGEMQVLADALISQGSLSEVPAYSRVVAEAALRYNAHSVVLCHNHPAGTAFPSQGDIDTTGRLARLLTSLEVVLLDHIIVADGQSFSMNQNQLIRPDVGGGIVRNYVADSSGEVRIRDQLLNKGRKPVKHEQPRTVK